MRLQFWKKAPKPMAEKERRDLEWEKLRAEEIAAHLEWEALPDHRKAARIEYQMFKAMCGPSEEERARAALYEAWRPATDFSHLAYQNQTPAVQQFMRQTFGL